MKLAIMQPYIFPYLGYFQLIASCDRFVVYDDVNFIKQGWINRNRILLQGRDFLFTVPLREASSHKTISVTEINKKNYSIWVPKFLNTVTQAYAKAPFFTSVFPLIQRILEVDHETINTLALQSIKDVCQYLSIPTHFIDSSRIYENSHLKAQSRILDICKMEKAKIYINPMGGKDLYSRQDFKSEGVELFFIEPHLTPYVQPAPAFVGGLSIIDVLMYNAVGDVQSMVKNYSLI